MLKLILNHIDADLDYEDWLRALIPPPRPPTPALVATVVTASPCEPHHAFIEAQLRLRRNAIAIYQDLVDHHGFAGAYNSVKRFACKPRHRKPEQFDRLAFLPGEEMQVDYGEGALTRVPGTDRYCKPRLFVATLRYSRRSFRCVVWRSSQQTWAWLHEQAWRRFGGGCRCACSSTASRSVTIRPRPRPCWPASTILAAGQCTEKFGRNGRWIALGCRDRDAVAAGRLAAGRLAAQGLPATTTPCQRSTARSTCIA